MPHPHAYSLAVEAYAELGVDTEAVLKSLQTIPLSLQCWQGDDVAGLEGEQSGMAGSGLAATGNYPGCPRNGDELRADLDLALRLIPGPTKLNLHACYAEKSGDAHDRDAYTVDHFSRWLDWATERGMGMDFNPSFFNHRLAADGLTLTHPDPAVRDFWVAHGQACRRIGEAFGKKLGQRCTVNLWIPDGSKDRPADRLGPRIRLTEALDQIFADPLDPASMEDAVESKLFGIGSESYVVGSHEFYLGYAIQKQKVLCLDSGHFHPTETLEDKISAIALHVPAILLHLSRGVRWDSDHVVILDDPTRGVVEEVFRHDLTGRVRFGLDFFDASINRIAAWVIGARAARKAMLLALLQPHAKLIEIEQAQDYTTRLALMESLKLMPAGAVWDEFCERTDTPAETQWLKEVKQYEKTVLSVR